MDEIMAYLKKYGQRFDIEIAEATDMPLVKVRRCITELANRGEITKCKVTQYEGDKTFEGILCRAAGFIPPTSPGRKIGQRNSTPSR